MLRLICFIARKRKVIHYSIRKLTTFCVDIVTVNIVMEIILESLITSDQVMSDIATWINNYYAKSNEGVEFREDNYRDENKIYSSRKRLKRYHSSDAKTIVSEYKTKKSSGNKF